MGMSRTSVGLKLGSSRLALFHFENKAPQSIQTTLPIYLCRQQMKKNCSTYEVKPCSNITILKQNTLILPLYHKNYKIRNVGKTDVHAELLYGTAYTWLGEVESAVVKPQKTIVLENHKKLYFVTGLRIINKSNVRAIVAASKTFLTAAHPHIRPLTRTVLKSLIDLNKVFKQVAILATRRFVPYIGIGLSAALTALWPDLNPNVWEEVKDKVDLLVESRIVQALEGNLVGDLWHIREKIKVLDNEIESGQRCASRHYMGLAMDLIGFQRKFVIGNNTPDYRNINFLFLPLYSRCICLQLLFYTRGVVQKDKIGLNADEVECIKCYAASIIYGEDGAINYIKSLYQERVDNAYNEAPVTKIFDEIMKVRTFVALHGLEYIPVWNSMIENPFQDKNVYIDVISYSSHYGKPTGGLNEQGIHIGTPLTPAMVEGRRNKMVSIDFYLWRLIRKKFRVVKEPPVIAGLTLLFENGDRHTMGVTTTEVKSVEFKDTTLVKVIAYGNKAIDRLDLSFSDGREFSVGTTTKCGLYKVFEMRDHHIVSMFVDVDLRSLLGQAANIAVSYQLNETETMRKNPRNQS